MTTNKNDYRIRRNLLGMYSIEYNCPLPVKKHLWSRWKLIDKWYPYKPISRLITNSMYVECKLWICWTKERAEQQIENLRLQAFDEAQEDRHMRAKKLLFEHWEEIT